MVLFCHFFILRFESISAARMDGGHLVITADIFVGYGNSVVVIVVVVVSGLQN